MLPGKTALGAKRMLNVSTPPVACAHTPTACSGPLPRSLSAAKILLLLNTEGSGLQQVVPNRFQQRLPAWLYYDL